MMRWLRSWIVRTSWSVIVNALQVCASERVEYWLGRESGRVAVVVQRCVRVSGRDRRGDLPNHHASGRGNHVHEPTIDAE